jgi:hypothetical protein
MELRDEKLIAKLIGKNQSLKDYVNQHQQYERQLEEFNKQIYLSTEETLKRKKIQKLKLAARDHISRILAEHRRIHQQEGVQSTGSQS